jgi:uncharacterized membrane protein
MHSNSLAPKTSKSRPLYQAILAGLIALFVVSGAIGGFSLGRRFNREPYIEKVRDVLAIEGAGLSLYQALGRELDDPLTERAMACR